VIKAIKATAKISLVPAGVLETETESDKEEDDAKGKETARSKRQKTNIDDCILKTSTSVYNTNEYFFRANSKLAIMTRCVTAAVDAIGLDFLELVPDVQAELVPDVQAQSDGCCLVFGLAFTQQYVCASLSCEGPCAVAIPTH